LCRIGETNYPIWSYKDNIVKNLIITFVYLNFAKNFNPKSFAMNLLTVEIPIDLSKSCINPKSTLKNYEIDVTKFAEIPKDYKAETAIIAQLNGGGYAELIWSINNITPEFKLSLFINNPQDYVICPVLTMKVVIIYS